MSSLVDWPVYPRLMGAMQGSEWARNSVARVAIELRVEQVGMGGLRR
jgi:hypothetical protein